MIQKIRESKTSKILATYLALQLIIAIVQPTFLYALTSGPSQPEFNSFTPIGTSDMVDLTSGDFNYNIPIMDVGGYPLNLAYDSGITMDQEASWVGLGWNLNVGQIKRQVRGIPDDFKGDTLQYEKNLKKHVTVGLNAKVDPQVFGLETGDYVNASLGLGIQYSNYHGITFKPSYGLSFAVSDNVNVGMSVQTSTLDGATISPNISAKKNIRSIEGQALNGSLNAGISFNSNKGLSSFSLSASSGVNVKNKDKSNTYSLGGTSGSLSFSDITVTPRKRTAFKDINSNFSFSVGGDIWGLDGEVELSASASVQKIKDKQKLEKAYGYEHTGQAGSHDILDYNRENDREISKSLLALPYTNYTYDLYSVNAQGIGGMFRPHRTQVGQIYDEYVKDESLGFSLGGEIEAGTGFHVGANFVMSPSRSHTGVWKTTASKYLKNENENAPNQAVDNEPVYFKYVGTSKVDQEAEFYKERLGGDSPIALKIGGGGFNSYADTKFRVKTYDPVSQKPKYDKELGFQNNFKRTKRDIRNQGVQKLTKKEVKALYKDSYYKDRISAYAKDHHTAQLRVLKPDGATYVFGETAYNIKKQEVTFATNSTQYDCAKGIVKYNTNNTNENTVRNTSGVDHFYDKVETPAYAHTYLLSSVLSADYEDRSGDGPTEDDLGSYTLFEYEVKEKDPYRWRIPYGHKEASYNAGLNSHRLDQKGSYIYGEKEIKYIRKITTKTHVAIFDLSKRKDARGVKDHNGGEPIAGQHMYKIDQIRLYAKPEYEKYKKDLEDDDESNDPTIQQLTPVKTAHFVYDYSQCQGVENNFESTLDDNELDYFDDKGEKKNKGKLTLKKVYFTYRGSKMGKYTPYTFEYNGTNPDYNLKSYDVWGNYKPNKGSCIPTDTTLTAPEFPFVDQTNKALQDQYTAAWSLTDIGLPSGGTLSLSYESDDYQYVQDKDPMQMFKVVGVGNKDNPTTSNPKANQILYKGAVGEAKYLYVELPNENDVTIDFKSKYLKGQEQKPMYFRFLVNMTKAGAIEASQTDFDYVTGYFERDAESKVFKAADGKIYASIPMKHSEMEGGVDGGMKVNPISKAGWYFGRNYLNRIVYDELGADYGAQESAGSIAKKLISSIGAIGQIFSGPNGKLRSNSHLCAQRFVPQKSWIRLSVPNKRKLGGGVRVKQLVMTDQWDKMGGGESQTYGQTYDYTLEDGTTSGVATFEPNDSAENPFVQPFYDQGKRLIAPREVSYVEKPFGKAFFPNAKVTYGRVTVKNLERKNITKHATGKIITEHYTSRDFPTKVDYTDMDKRFPSNQNNILKQLIGGLFGAPVNVKNEFTMTQGYAVHTNDMDGKQKGQYVYQEGMDKPISSVIYKYHTEVSDDSKLNNTVPIIYKDGTIQNNQQIGIDYDVINDFRESYSNSKSIGGNVNVVTFFVPIFIVIVFTAFPTYVEHENIAHSAITTKVVHQTGILKEKIATDLGAKVSVTNEAWDAETGEVLLTKTVNEFDDSYYNFNFPAYWNYDRMGQATKNLGNKGVLTPSGDYFTLPNVKQYLTLGDEILASYGKDTEERLWIVGFNDTKTAVLLMDDKGLVVNKSAKTIQENLSFKVVRSGYRNLQQAKMGSITMMKNPLKGKNGNWVNQITDQSFYQSEDSSPTDQLKIINGSAVDYDEFWNCQCENGLESIPFATPDSDQLADLNIEEYGFNPYLYNVKGDWKAKQSYAYLTERIGVTQGGENKKNTRKEGYFKDFTPYYTLIDDKWVPHEQAKDNWTFASEVTQYSPFGVEIENKDALDRYSSAQYGYNFTLPVAVTSNSKYRYMGADNFEDYSFLNTDNGHYSFKEQVTGDGDKGIAISTTHAHTGNTSLWIPKNNGASMTTQLQGDIVPDDDYDDDGWKDDEDNCPYTYNRSQTDYDNDGIGDSCDDNAVPLITDIKKSGQFYGWREQATFTIQGTPNTEVVCKITPQSYGNRGAWLSVNGEGFKMTNKEITLKLGPTGRTLVQFEARANRGKKSWFKTKPNRIAVDFRILHQDGITPVYNSPVIRLDPVGYRNLGSGGEHGSSSLFPSIL